MKQTQLATFAGLLAILACLCCPIAVAEIFTVRGIFIPDEPESSTNRAQFEEAQVRVLIRENEDTTTASESVLVSGSMRDGEISLTGEVDTVTTVTISVDAGLNAPLELNAVIAPGREVSFALLEWPTVLAFLGGVNTATDLSQKFIVSGNLSSVNFDLQHANVLARVLKRDALGEMTVQTWDLVLHNNRFEIIGEVKEPRVVNIFIYQGASYTQTQAIIEPGAEIILATPTGSFKDIVATARSGKGKHALLIDSWQQTEEYWSTKREYVAALNRYQTELLEQRTENVGSSIKPNSEVASPLDDGTAESDIAKNENEDSDECAKYAPRRKNTRNQVADLAEVPEHVKVLRKLKRLKLDPLEKIAQQAENPIDALLALDLGAFWGEPERQTVYDRLERTLDSEIVSHRVIHDRNDHARYLSQQEKIFSLFVGTKAPEFTLKSIEDSSIALYDVVKDFQYVLLEFWASWCGPCIRILPDLKTVYAQHTGEKFEVVSVSIDRDRTSWEEASKEFEIPWINLAELDPTTSKVSSIYGVEYIPKNYLLDSKGCIVQKDVTVAQLDQILASADDLE